MTAVIEFDAVGRTYPGPPPVAALHPADLVVESGQYVAVVGPSGSGKSTFLNLVGLLDVPSTGHYRLDGIDAGELSENHRAALRGRRIGFVFQAFHLLPHRTALENVMLGMLYQGVPRAERQDRALAALTEVRLAHRLLALPSQMSGGERQRVAVARALVNEPSLLLCDEPTGNLDTVTAEAVLELFHGLHARGMTLVMVTHNDDVAERADRIVTIRDGRLEERR
ncbi:ABC transporter ATP-binding protein [Paractinoplanes ferrugineus]|uniref:ABC transporter ATP-binding protein n=1 Tax=Paractinoplanes ferrugineus TaxID=113564 RepID=A0A919MCA5_9ACTN|nr:ABC transporter ATP-binding protein [Actinoplanes ferrugineus]GIE10548.1 ABC transporter ATP-binding protein [Actinoplanes ferrugineus]